MYMYMYIQLWTQCLNKEDKHPTNTRYAVWYSLPYLTQILLAFTVHFLSSCIYSVSQKNIPDIFSRNSRKHCWIFIMFGTHVTEKGGNQ